jgi:hypothetical protein
LAHGVRIDIQDRVRRLSKYPREEDKGQIESLRQLLIQQLTVLDSVQRQAVQEGFDSDFTNIIDDVELFDDLDGDGDTDGAMPNLNTRSEPALVAASDSVILPPERTTLSIPSNWSSQNNQYRQAELDIRIKQASKTLHSLRDVIAEKSFQYSHVIRVAPKKGVRTRARANIATLNHRIAYLARVYGCSRAAMVRLSANTPTLKEYQVLLPEHMKSSTAILDPNQPGSTRLHLSWIWQVGPAADSNSVAAVQECK